MKVRGSLQRQARIVLIQRTCNTKAAIYVKIRNAHGVLEFLLDENGKRVDHACKHYGIDNAAIQQAKKTLNCVRFMECGSPWYMGDFPDDPVYVPSHRGYILDLRAN